MTSPGLTPGTDDQAQRIADFQRQMGVTPSPPSKPKPPAKPKPVPALQQAVEKAKQVAARTGIPQPVRARDGHVVYYVDYDGSVVPDSIAKDRIDTARQHGRKTPAFEPSDQSKATPGSIESGQLAKERAQQAADSARKASAVEQANAEIGYVWVDGKPLKVTAVNKDGSYQVSIGNGKAQPFSQGTPSAFGALDNASGALDPNTRFTMAAGPGDIFTGKTAEIPGMAPNYGGPHPGNFAAAEHGALANTVSNTTNQMTVGQSLSWLASLSTKDPASYKAMVDKLHDAGYLSDAAYAAYGGGGYYNAVVGQAFAQAATDTAVVNTTPEGIGVSLYDVLDQRAKANKASTASSYKPVERNFTDPAAIEAAARSQAESDLGRDLSPDEVQQLVDKFHGAESGMFDTIDAAGRSGKNATYTQPNATGAIDQFIHDGPLAQDAANWRVAEYGQVLNKLFGLTG